MSDFGARFDIETDALLALILSLHVCLSSVVGAEGLIFGIARYVFVAAAVVWSFVIDILWLRARRMKPRDCSRAIAAAALLWLVLALPGGALESGLDPQRRDHLYRTERDNLSLARHVLVPSPHTRDILIGRYDVPTSRITISRPGVDPACLPRDPILAPLILSVGILHPRNGHDVLIRALADISDLDWQAVIIGNPWDEAHARALHRQLDESGLSRRLRLAGLVSADELHRHYARASVFALATRCEGYGIVFDEALSYGLPIVTCATGAVPQTVPFETGLLVPPDDGAAFAGALRRMLTQTDIRSACASAAARVGRDLPGWSSTAAAAGQVLDRIR